MARVFLPRSFDEPDSLPRVDRMRDRLGGRQAHSCAPQPVLVQPSGAVGLVLTPLTSTGDAARGARQVDVLLPGDRVRRTSPAQLAPATFVPDGLRASLDALTAFAALAEGDHVYYEDAALGVTPGTLAEKCRWGALVVRDEDEAVVAVGFRKIWPSAASDGPTS